MENVEKIYQEYAHKTDLVNENTMDSLEECIRLLQRMDSELSSVYNDAEDLVREIRSLDQDADDVLGPGGLREWAKKAKLIQRSLDDAADAVVRMKSVA